MLDADISINSRDDIVLGGEKKISGTAAKLSRQGSYHHCTLLVSVDTTNLHQALNNPASDIINTNATKSVRSPVENLITHDNNDDIIDEIETAIASEFSVDSDIVDVDPSEENYEGLENIVNNYQSWRWTFGKSPKFTINVDDEEYEFNDNKLKLLHSDKIFTFNEELLNQLINGTCDEKLARLGRVIKNIL